MGDVEMRGCEVSTGVVKWSEDPVNRMSITFRNMYITWNLLLIWLFLLSYNLICSVSILYHCICGCVFCELLYSFVNYILLLLCNVIVMFMYFFVMFGMFCVLCYIVLFCVLFVCKCVLYCCYRVSTQLQLTNYITSYIIYLFIIKAA